MVSPFGQELQKQDRRAPEGAHQSAYNAVLALPEHVGGVGLHALEGGNDGIEGLAAHSAKGVDDHAQPYGNNGADDALTGRNDLEAGSARRGQMGQSLDLKAFF